VNFLLIRTKFSTSTCFGIWLPSSGGREFLISYLSNVLCYGCVRIMTRPVRQCVASVARHVSAYGCHPQGVVSA
jgi:hypothetical protein